MPHLPHRHLHRNLAIILMSAVGNPPVLRNWVGEKPCQDSWVGIKCNGKLKSSTVVSMKLVGYKLEGSISPALQNMTSLTTLWLNDNYLRGYIPSELGNLKRLKSLRLSNNSLRGIVLASLTLLPNLKELVDGNDDLCSQSGSYNLSACPFPSNATLTFPSPRILNDEDPGKTKAAIAAIIGGAVGAVILVLLTISLVCYYLIRARKFSTGWAAGCESPLPASGISLQEIQGARLFAFVEIEHTTKNLNERNLIDQGIFGLVYKGLLYDGTIIAIKRRTDNPSQYLANEVFHSLIYDICIDWGRCLPNMKSTWNYEVSCSLRYDRCIDWGKMFFLHKSYSELREAHIKSEEELLFMKTSVMLEPIPSNSVGTIAAFYLNIIYKMDHSVLRVALTVSKEFSEAAILARKEHFLFLTPRKNKRSSKSDLLEFMNSHLLGCVDENLVPVTPNAPNKVSKLRKAFMNDPDLQVRFFEAAPEPVEADMKDVYSHGLDFISGRLL